MFASEARIAMLNNSGAVILNAGTASLASFATELSSAAFKESVKVLLSDSTDSFKDMCMVLLKETSQCSCQADVTWE
jgi:hypothetical protein